MFPVGSLTWGWALSHLHLPFAISPTPHQAGASSGISTKGNGVISCKLSPRSCLFLCQSGQQERGALTSSTIAPREQGKVLSLFVTKANSLFPAHQLFWVLNLSFLISKGETIKRSIPRFLSLPWHSVPGSMCRVTSRRETAVVACGCGSASSYPPSPPPTPC